MDLGPNPGCHSSWDPGGKDGGGGKGQVKDRGQQRLGSDRTRDRPTYTKIIELFFDVKFARRCPFCSAFVTTLR